MSEAGSEAEREAAFESFMDQSHNSKVPEGVWGQLKDVVVRVTADNPHDDAVDISEAVSLATGIEFTSKPDARAALYYLGARAAAKTYETALSQNQEFSDKLASLGEGPDTADIRQAININDEKIPQVADFARLSWDMLNQMPQDVVNRVSKQVEEHYKNQKVQ